MGESIQSAIDEVLKGRIDAYAEVVRRYQDEVWRIVAFALRDVAATEDLVQQVFVNAYVNLETYRAGMDFGAWLRSIARNLVRSEIRRRMRDEKKLKAYHERLLERFGDDKSAERHEARLREALSRCRKKLAPTSRRALDLRYARALGFRDVAETLGRTVAATRQMLARVRLALRRCIEGRMARS